MARPLRITYPGAVYYMASRGNERKPGYKMDIQCWFQSISSSLCTVLVAAGSSGSRLTLWVARLMTERSTINWRATSVPDIDKYYVDT